MGAELPGQMRIGSVLEQARVRAGLELREVEQRTKIRIKYLQALEDSEWSALPSFAYAKGFLRTYGELLGLDGEALVDEFRRQVEPDADARGYPLDERIERRPSGGGDRSRLWPAIVVGVLIATGGALLIVIDDEDGGGGEPRRQAGEGRFDQRQNERDGRERGRDDDGPVELVIRVREALEICLVGGGGKALIDGQVLAAGTRERYVRERFELRSASGFDAEQLRLRIGGRRRTLQARGPAAFEITAPARVRRLASRERSGCP